MENSTADFAASDSSLVKTGSWSRTWLMATAAILLCLMIGTILIMACVPPVSRDALTHHLAVPKLYLQNGGIYEIPEIPFSYYPMNLDLLYMVPLYFGNDIIPKYIHFAFALLTAGLIYAYLRSRLGSAYASFGVLFFLSIPVVVKLSVTVYVDLGLIFFCFGSLLALFRWRQTCFRHRYLVLAGALCGLALGTKYNALVALFIFAVMVPVIYIRHHRGSHVLRQCSSAAAAAVFICVALVVFSPWMIRNALWTGNPIYPLYRGFFTSIHQAVAETQEDPGSATEDDPQESKRTRWSHIATRRLVYGESWWQIALLPLRIFFQGQDDNPQYFDGRLNPFLLLLPLAAFSRRPRLPEEQRFENRMLLIFVVLFTSFAFVSHGIRIRYIAPVIPPLVVLAAFGLHNLVEVSRRFQGKLSARQVCTALVLVALALNAYYILNLFHKVAPVEYLEGKIDRAGYIARHRPEYLIWSYANTALDSDVKILAMFIGNRRYYSDRDLIVQNSLLRSQVIAGRSAAEIADRLQRRGITHLFVGIDLFNRWGADGLDHDQKLQLQQFFDRYTKLLKAEGGYGLFLLQSPAG